MSQRRRQASRDYFGHYNLIRNTAHSYIGRNRKTPGAVSHGWSLNHGLLFSDDESPWDEETPPLPQHHYFIVTETPGCHGIRQEPLPNSRVIPTHATTGDQGEGGHTWFSSCTSMLYWGPGWTSVTFSPRRKPRRVMSVFAASSTDGGGPSSCSVSPKHKKTRFRQELFAFGCCPVVLLTQHTLCTLKIQVFRLFTLFKSVLPRRAGH